MEVRIDGRKVELGQTEYQILLLLMENKGRTVTRQRLLEQVWDSGGSYVNDNTLTVAVKRLREKLGSPESLRTVRSFGYRMEAGDEKGEREGEGKNKKRKSGRYSVRSGGSLGRGGRRDSAGGAAILRRGSLTCWDGSARPWRSSRPRPGEPSCAR